MKIYASFQSVKEYNATTGGTITLDGKVRKRGYVVIIRKGAAEVTEFYNFKGRAKLRINEINTGMYRYTTPIAFLGEPESYIKPDERAW